MTVGETIMEAVVALAAFALQSSEPPVQPATVRLVLCPAQMTGLTGVIASVGTMPFSTIMGQQLAAGQLADAVAVNV